MNLAEAGPDPALARRNLIMGLLLGGLVVAVVVAFMFIFHRNGLPKDPDVWRRMHREGLAGYPLGVAPGRPLTDDAPATPEPQESTR